MSKAPDPSRASRREFLKSAAAVPVASALAGALPTRLAAAGQVPETVSSFPLEEVALSELLEKLGSGELTSLRATELYLERIEAIDQRGPTLRSVIETNPDAADLAEQLDRERAAGQVRGPLHGVPILLKDNVATADMTMTTAGSLALEGSHPPEDSEVAKRLRAAGAVLLGKANLSEWANFRSTNSSSGWSARGGQCRNPYVLDRNPCGSSSGSGASASASLCAAAIGTETNGSIVCPSSANGLVGIKPTVGLVSRRAIIPISETQDTAGPMARTVRDATLVLTAIAGTDPRDEATREADAQRGDYTRFLDANGLNGARIGVPRSFYGFDPRVDDLMEAALQAMKEAGAEIVDELEFKNREEMGEASRTTMLYEFKDGLAKYFAGLGADAPVRSLADCIAFNEANAEREMPWFGQELFHLAEEKGPLSEPEYVEARDTAVSLARQGLDGLLDEHRLDALVAPTGGPAWVTDWVNGDHFSGGSSSPAAISGYPNITVPAGFIHGLPVGVSIFGRRFGEPGLIRLAYAFEQATGHRRAPTFRPTAAWPA